MSDDTTAWVLSDSELETATKILDGMGVSYEAKTVYRLEVTVGSNDTSETDETDDTDDRRDRGLPDEDTRIFQVAYRVGNHDREWVNARDIDVTGDEWALSLLWDRGIVDRRQHTRENCSYEYRLRDSYRRELELVADEIVGESE